MKGITRMGAAAAAGLVAVGLLATPAGAAITRSDFPTASSVKADLSGAGSWTRHVSRGGIGAPLGAVPARCASHLPFQGAVESRAAFYRGALRGTSQIHGQAAVEVYRYSTKAKARRAVAATAAFVKDCPTSVEWVCERCDGIWESRRTPARARSVGAESVAWTERQYGMGVDSMRVITARTGRTVVQVSVSRVSSPEDMTVPKPPTWASADGVAKAAVRAAR